MVRKLAASYRPFFSWQRSRSYIPGPSKGADGITAGNHPADVAATAAGPEPGQEPLWSRRHPAGFKPYCAQKERNG